MKLKLVPIVLVFLFGIFVTSSLAASERSVSVRKNPGATNTLFATASATPKARGKSLLAGAKLKACQAKANAITKKLDQLNRFVANMIGKFDAIALRVKNFYTGKVLPTGKTLSNYDALVSDIAAKKVLVNDALTKAQSDSTGFSCEEGDPKGLLKQYRLDMQAVKQALGDYRKSIRNLIVGVHTLVPTIESSESSEKSEGTSTPTATATSSATPAATATPLSTPTASPTATPALSPTATPN